MSYVRRFMVVSAASAACAREVSKKIADTMSVGSADGMWSTGLNSTGVGPATYYVTEGPIDAGFASLLGNASSTFAQYQAAGGTTYTLTDISTMYAASTIRSDLAYPTGALDGISALGLRITTG